MTLLCASIVPCPLPSKQWGAKGGINTSNGQGRYMIWDLRTVQTSDDMYEGNYLVSGFWNCILVRCVR
ncbi:hypothetical protein Anacy_4989 [Anabaena cylindrica PCC 7122]|uniref:Uncharacterized protein n=1 Tax=Anabaena cylindrica (strain ATCC 27899 / PCC 7122) TaxID=272123 RepID=K9ZNG3_ANACC|nr:hypothetical protein Anacy_4989 [Anabaena cylindrica PCC 7122]BAY02600.1 hypothetical protein NIES19_18460 [Anabaena cylindrica PCC 7122]